MTNEWKKERSRAQIKLPTSTLADKNEKAARAHLLFCLPLPSDTDKHACCCQAVRLWIVLWFEAFEVLPCRWSLGSWRCITGALNPASLLCTPASGCVRDHAIKRWRESWSSTKLWSDFIKKKNMGIYIIGHKSLEGPVVFEMPEDARKCAKCCSCVDGKHFR